MYKILFVCLGNICRSPMAEAILNDKLKKHNLENEVWSWSKAVSSYEAGNPPHSGAIAELAKHGLTIQHQSNQIKSHDFKDFDLVIGMDKENIKALKRIAPKDQIDKIKLMMSFDKNTPDLEVPDPWYDHNFARTYDMLNHSTDILLEELMDKNKKQ